MSKRSSRKKRHSTYSSGVYKLIDDRSGFEVYSDEAIIDEQRGLVTSRNNYDPPHYTEFGPFEPIIPPEPILPFTRPEPTDNFIDVTEVDYPT